MTGRIHTYLSVGTAFVLSTFVLLTLYAVVWPPNISSNFLSEPLRGVSVIVKGKAHTLNFTQQKHVLAYLQRSVAFEGKSSEARGMSLPIDKIVFHRFEGKDWELEPLGWQEQKMIFRSPETQKTLIDSSEGHLFSLLAITYD